MKKAVFLLVMIGIIIGTMNYLDAGYNEFLSRDLVMPLTSEVDPLQFDTLTTQISGDKIDSELQGQFVGSGINATNITAGEMSFDRAKGGTLQLGGFNNSSGIFSLVDEDTTERIKMDKDGMTVSGGKITVKDTNNNAVIDSSGIISTANFKNTLIFDDTLYTINSGTNSNLSALRANIIAPRGLKVLVGCVIYTTVPASAGAILKFTVDNTAVYSSQLYIDEVTSESKTMIHLIEIGKGHHTIGVNVAASGDTVTINNGGSSSQIFYVILGS